MISFLCSGLRLARKRPIAFAAPWARFPPDRFAAGAVCFRALAFCFIGAVRFCWYALNSASSTLPSPFASIFLKCFRTADSAFFFFGLFFLAGSPKAATATRSVTHAATVPIVFPNIFLAPFVETPVRGLFFL